MKDLLEILTRKDAQLLMDANLKQIALTLWPVFLVPMEFEGVPIHVWRTLLLVVPELCVLLSNTLHNVHVQPNI